METLLKRHFWLVTLLGLAVVAWLTAGSVTALVGMVLVRQGKSDAKPNVAEAKGETAVSKRLRAGRLDGEAGAVIAGRSIFLIEEPPEKKEDEAEGDGATDEQGNPIEKELPPLEPTYEPTTLPIKLLGTMVVTPDEFSSGSVELDKKDQKVIGIHSVLLDGKAEVMAIRRNYIILKEDNKLTIAPLFAKEKDAAGSDPAHPGSTPEAPKRSSQADVKKPAEAKVAGVEKISDTNFKLGRDHINDKLKDLASLGAQVKIVANYRNGKYSGVKMIGMQDSSLFKDIGFDNGDILMAVNGDHLDSPNKALALYDALKNKSRLTVLIERGGIDKTIRYSIN